jgi:glycosyltransferase A (GT-A) superfamily protein (DUF2064 family)
VTGFAAVVPVIDEREAVADVVGGLLRVGACCVFVVDGGSTDGTPDVAASAGAIVVSEPRRGYGRACLTGAERALRPDPHPHASVAFLDGDGSCDAAAISRLVAALDTAAVALGRRPARLIESGAMPWHARLGNRLVALIVSIRTGRRVHDLPPAKALRASALERLRLDETGYGWTVQLVGRALADPTLRVREIPVAFRRRRGGVSKVSGSVRSSALAARAMLRVAVQATRPRPVVALMAKAPRDGHAKTRLAMDLGAEPTAELWAACLGDSGSNLLEAARAGDMDPVVMLAGPADLAPVADILGPGWAPSIQRRAGLSGALIDVFLEAHDRGTDRAMAVAGDVPSLPPGYVVDALHRLADGADDAVMGPSADGGYHLVALRWPATPRWLPRAVRRRRRARLADRLRSGFDVPMGGTTALDATTGGLAAAGWRVTDLEPWADLDTIADLRGLVRDLDGDGRFAPRTTAWLVGHRSTVEKA